MFSVKKNVLQTVALLKEYGIKDIVVSPGSRNAPFLQTFSQDSSFKCHVVVDERNAAFYALGIIQSTKRPVVVCCTSGTALLNFAPAVAEAYYQQLPLVVVSADRSQEWIGQMDGQTIPQSGAFGTMVKKSVNLPEINSQQDEWFCNRLVNEALISCTAGAAGPVHLNVPISEPLFDYSIKELPKVRRINYSLPINRTNIQPFAEKWQSLPKRMIIVGQSFKDTALVNVLEKLAQHTDCIILTEYLSNCVSPLLISNFDAWLYALPEEEKNNFSPDLVITLGGHTVSKRLKQFLRSNRPQEHWHLTKSNEVIDLFQSLTELVETDDVRFLEDLISTISNEDDKVYQRLWKDTTETIEEPSSDIPFSDIQAVGAFLSMLPEGAVLHLANSSSVRNVQLYNQKPSWNIYCNRGTNGIESSLPSAVGFASVYKGITYLLIGDLSFFYGLNSLWNIGQKNLRILLINNGGGGIFHLLPGLSNAPSLTKYVAATHDSNAKEWIAAAQMRYLSAHDRSELDDALNVFMDETVDESIVLEVITDMEISKQVFKDYYHQLKNKRYGS